MPLVPVTGVLETIAKLERESPEAARALVVMALHDSLCEQVDALRGDLEPAVLYEMGEIAKAAKESLRRVSVTKALATGELYGQAEADALDAVQEYVEKGLIGSLLERFNRQHPRDEQGRFIRVEVKGQGTNRATVRHASHVQATHKVQQMLNHGLVTNDTPITLHVRSTDAGGQAFAPEEATETTPAKLIEQLGNLSEDQQITGVSVRRQHLPKNGAKAQAKLDLMGMITNQDALGSKAVLDRVERKTKAMGSADGIAGDWYGPSQGGASMDRQAYRRMKVTGQALSALSTPGSGLSVAGGVAQLVGEIGPEAEKVLAPGIRRAAYRYRGTERRPSGDLRRQVEEAQDFAEGKGNWDQRSDANPAKAIGSYHQKLALSEDQMALRTGGDATVAWMLGLTGAPSQLPDKKSAELSMASGEVPPSRGVIIDADGDLVSQAVGFNGDHYLPFDLRNLGRLYGGQYVRTRAQGGPTGEDLYASVMTGARQFQVVSNSGVFTVEFDPNLRGSRRYSDKARRMVTRYEQMLEVLADPNSKVFERDLSREQMTEIRRKAAQDSDTPEQFRQQVQAMTDHARMMGALASEEGDDDEAMDAAQRMATTRVDQEISSMPRAAQPSPQGRLRMIAERRNEEYAQLTGGQVKRLSLNGMGYYRALRALETEFPYFIRQTDWQSLPDWIATRGLRNTPGHARDRANDRGYVEPGQTNPAIGREGANARRVVPGAKLGQKAVADERTEGAAATVTSTTSTKAPVVPASPKQADYSPAALTKPGSKLFYALSDPAAKLLGVAAIMPPAMPYAGDPSKIGDISEPHEYIYALSRHIGSSGEPYETGRRFVKWYFTEANPQERAKVDEALEEIEAISAGYETAPEPQVIRSAFDSFRDARDLVFPYANVPKDSIPAMAIDTSDRPKPASPEALGLGIGFGASLQEIERAKARMVNTDPKAESLLKQMSQEDDHDRMKAVVAFRDRYEQNESDENLKALTRIHAVWSLLHTEEVTAKLADLIGGGAGPKAPEQGDFKKAHRPRRVIVHKADDPFSRRTLAALGIG